MNWFGAARGLCSAIGWVSILAAVCIQLAYPQAQIERTKKIPETWRTLPLTKFYDTPIPLPSKKPGELIRSEEFDEYALEPDVRAVRILYHSRSATGLDVAASGVVLYPDRKPPGGGWPVIVWAHAQNGVARQCAPSLARNLQHGPFLSMYVSLGYAVVATDYVGLGTSFRNAFSDLPSNANDLIYSVPAARAAVPQLGSRWVAIGVGRGGAVVVGVAEMQRELGDLNYLGSIAISGLDDLPDRYENSGAQNLPETPLFLAYGIKTIYPEFDVKEILTAEGTALYPQVEQACAEPKVDSKRSQGELQVNWASDKFVKQYFNRSALGQKQTQAPLLVISSELDATTPIQTTSKVITRMCKQGNRVQFERYPQSEAGSVFGDSVRTQISWIQARFSGQPAPSNCSERP